MRVGQRIDGRDRRQQHSTFQALGDQPATANTTSNAFPKLIPPALPITHDNDSSNSYGPINNQAPTISIPLIRPTATFSPPWGRRNRGTLNPLLPLPKGEGAHRITTHRLRSN